MNGMDLTSADPDAAGCVCVVCSFAGAAQTINEVTAEAAKRAMMSPVLSDFIEFRFADLGLPPVPADDRSAAVRQVTQALLDAQSTAGRNYFAVVVVDKSAEVVEQVLSDCAASPLLADLPMEFLGIANSDDRPSREPGREGSFSPDIVTSPTGLWQKKGDLVDIVRRFAGELQHSFSASPEPGLSPAALADLRFRFRQQQISGADPAGQDTFSDRASSVSDPGPGRDLLADDHRPTPASAAQAQENQPPQVPRESAEQLPFDTLPTPHRQPQSQVTVKDEATSEPVLAEAPESAGPAARIRRRLSELRTRRAQQPGAAQLDPSAQDPVPKTERLIYLLIVGDESCRDEASLNRCRSALLEVDRKIADVPGYAYQVRMLHGDEVGLSGDLREAGQLGRRDVKRTVASVDFAAVLESVLASLKRDRGPLGASGATTRPAVIFFTPEPPLADTVAAELFRDLVREGSVVWALPKSAKPLLSAAFTDAPGVQVIVDDQAVADEIAALLSIGATAVKAGA